LTKKVFSYKLRYNNSQKKKNRPEAWPRFITEFTGQDRQSGQKIRTDNVDGYLKKGGDETRKKRMGWFLTSVWEEKII